MRALILTGFTLDDSLTATTDSTAVMIRSAADVGEGWSHISPSVNRGACRKPIGSAGRLSCVWNNP